MPDPFAEAPNLSRAKVEQDLKKEMKKLEYERQYVLPPFGE